MNDIEERYADACDAVDRLSDLAHDLSKCSDIRLVDIANVLEDLLSDAMSARDDLETELDEYEQHELYLDNLEYERSV